MKRYRLAQPWMFKNGKPDEHTIYTENRKGDDGWGEYMRLDADVVELAKRSKKLIEDALWGKWTQIDINKAEKHIAELEQIVRENEQK